MIEMQLMKRFRVLESTLVDDLWYQNWKYHAYDIGPIELQVVYYITYEVSQTSKFETMFMIDTRCLW